MKPSTIFFYLKSCGYLNLIFYFAFIILSRAFYVGTNIWLSRWSTTQEVFTTITREDESQAANSRMRHERLFIYVSLGLFQILFILIARLFCIKMTLASCTYLHDTVLYSIVRSPMQYFITTPIGRIINKMSKDLEVFHNSIPSSFMESISCLSLILSLDIIISYSTPWFLVTLAPVFILYMFIQRYFVASTRQLRRIESTSSSPIFSQFNESINGVSSIRAYKAQERFVRSMQSYLDENSTVSSANRSANRWVALRLEFIGNLMILTSSFLAAISRFSTTAGLAGVSISLSLNVNLLFLFFLIL